MGEFGGVVWGAERKEKCAAGEKKEPAPCEAPAPVRGRRSGGRGRRRRRAGTFIPDWHRAAGLMILVQLDHELGLLEDERVGEMD
jgi:hypothetical protein